MRARAVLALVAASGLSACGFAPLYSSASIPGGAQAAFASIAVAEIAPTNDSDRVGIYVMRELDAALRAAGSEGAPAYVLSVTLTDERRGLAIQDDSSITRYNYRLAARWTLTPAGAAAPSAEGRVQSIAAYNVVDSQYATLVARDDAERRAARDLADQIRLRLALALRAGS